MISRPFWCLCAGAGAVLLGAWQGQDAVPQDWVRLGGGAHRYAWVPGWGALPEGMAMGNTHGCMAVDAAGRIYANTDSENAVLVYSADGRLLRRFGAELKGGLHGMALVAEGDQEFLYLSHIGLHEVFKTTLDGEVLWRRGHPEASGLYQSAEQYRPTGVAVAPNGDYYVADGYGLGYVHQFRPDGTWLHAFGGPGEEPGRFRTPHGIWLDRRGATPRLLVADRENQRLQAFSLAGELEGVLPAELRRPCTVYERGGYLAVADLAGRVTILDAEDRLVTHLGDNPDPAKRANNGVPPEQWAAGEFLAPHGVAWDARGDLYVLDWNARGRLSKLVRLPDGGSDPK